MKSISQPDNDQDFFCKLLLNVLSNFNDTYTEFSLLFRMVHDPLLNGPWFSKIKTILAEASSDDTLFGGAMLLRNVVTRKDVQDIVAQIYAARPEFKQKPVPRATSLTLAELLDLDDLETLVLDSACRFNDMPYQIRGFFDNMDAIYPNHPQLLSIMYKTKFRNAQKTFDGFLFQAGILSKEGCAPEGLYGLNIDLCESFSNKTLSMEDLDTSLFPHMLKTSLTTEDYSHLKKEIGLLTEIIEKNQKSKKEAGVNVMLWGLPGAGKTELTVALAKERGWNLKVIGDISPDNLQEKSRYNRLASLKMATKIFRNQPNTVLLFDEMEDLFKIDTTAAFSKAFINRIIETTEIPIIWTTNSIEVLGQPVLRRMVYNIGFEVPPEDVRAKMWNKYALAYKVKVDPQSLIDVAKTYDVSPAVIKNAMQVTGAAYGRKKVTKSDLVEIVGSLDTLVNYGHKRKIKEDYDKGDDTYDVSCIHADQDIETFVNRVVGAKNPAFAMCFYGVPGSGKSELGRYIAKKMGKEVLYKRASDLIDCWVGVSEQNIAAAFEEAKKKKMVLMIDEGDSFLRDREKARQSWEVTMVNEMLSQMERHPQPFILTTNLMRDLDAASLRRFTFKVKFDFLKPSQARKLFSGYFSKEAPLEIDRNFMLVPGDFANVKRQADVLGITDANELYRMLDAEVKLKPNKQGGIGF